MSNLVRIIIMPLIIHCQNSDRAVQVRFSGWLPYDVMSKPDKFASFWFERGRMWSGIHNTTCKSGFLDLSIVYILIEVLRFGSWIFFRLQVKRKDRNPSWSEASSTRGPNNYGFCPSFLPEDGRRSSFRNVVILLKYRRWTKSKKQLLQIIMHHRQNPLDLIYDTTSQIVLASSLFENNQCV
jgi:hypothetical protein